LWQIGYVADFETPVTFHRFIKLALPANAETASPNAPIEIFAFRV
jgi:hypothetical protein